MGEACVCVCVAYEARFPEEKKKPDQVLSQSPTHTLDLEY